jgi:hypothetical protein
MSQPFVRFSLIGAPLLTLAGALVSPPIESDTAAQIAVIGDHPAAWYWSNLLGLAGVMLFVPALLGLMRLARVSRLGEAGGALAVFGTLVAIGDAATQLLIWQMGDGDHAQMAALLDRYDNAAGAALVFTVGGLALIAGSVLLAVALRGTVPTWAAAGLPAGLIVNIAGYAAASTAILSLSGVILLAALGRIALGERVGSRAGMMPAASGG